jgi:hypothetical protein
MEDCLSSVKNRLDTYKTLECEIEMKRNKLSNMNTLFNEIERVFDSDNINLDKCKVLYNTNKNELDGLIERFDTMKVSLTDDFKILTEHNIKCMNTLEAIKNVLNIKNPLSEPLFGLRKTPTGASDSPKVFTGTNDVKNNASEFTGLYGR